MPLLTLPAAPLLWPAPLPSSQRKALYGHYYALVVGNNDELVVLNGVLRDPVSLGKYEPSKVVQYLERERAQGVSVTGVYALRAKPVPVTTVLRTLVGSPGSRIIFGMTAKNKYLALNDVSLRKDLLLGRVNVSCGSFLVIGGKARVSDPGLLNATVCVIFAFSRVDDFNIRAEDLETKRSPTFNLVSEDGMDEVAVALGIADGPAANLFLVVFAGATGAVGVVGVSDAKKAAAACAAEKRKPDAADFSDERLAAAKAAFAEGATGVRRPIVRRSLYADGRPPDTIVDLSALKAYAGLEPAPAAPMPKPPAPAKPSSKPSKKAKQTSAPPPPPPTAPPPPPAAAPPPPPAAAFTLRQDHSLSRGRHEARAASAPMPKDRYESRSASRDRMRSPKSPRSPERSEQEWLSRRQYRSRRQVEYHAARRAAAWNERSPPPSPNAVRNARAAAWNERAPPHSPNAVRNANHRPAPPEKIPPPPVPPAMTAPPPPPYGEAHPRVEAYPGMAPAHDPMHAFGPLPAYGHMPAQSARGPYSSMVSQGYQPPPKSPTSRSLSMHAQMLAIRRADRAQAASRAAYANLIAMQQQIVAAADAEVNESQLHEYFVRHGM